MTVAVACSAVSEDSKPLARDSDTQAQDKDPAEHDDSEGDAASRENACAYPSANCGAGAAGCVTALLDDPANCGRCGHDCLGGGCLAGQCQAAIVVPNMSIAGSLFPTEKKISWVEWDTNSGYATIYGGVLDLATKAVEYFGKPKEGTGILMADDSSVYVGTPSYDGAGVRRIPTDGSSSSTIFDGYAREAILVGGTFYFNTRKRTFDEETRATTVSGPVIIYSMPSSGGSKKLVGSIPADGLYENVRGLREQGGFLYLVNVADRAIVRAPSTGGTFEKVVADNAVQIIGFEKGALYYASFTPSGDDTTKIMRFDLASHKSTPVGNRITGSVEVLMDSTSFYWVEPNLGVRRMPLQGGTPVTVFQRGLTSGSSSGVQNLAQNARALYWTINDSGTAIFQLAK